MERFFWTAVCFLTIAWYIVVTAVVAYKGGQDIKNMLKKLNEEEDKP